MLKFESSVLCPSIALISKPAENPAAANRDFAIKLLLVVPISSFLIEIDPEKIIRSGKGTYIIPGNFPEGCNDNFIYAVQCLPLFMNRTGICYKWQEMTRTCLQPETASCWRIKTGILKLGNKSIINIFRIKESLR